MQLLDALFKYFFYLAVTMTLTEAFQDLITSATFKEVSKRKDSQGGKYRKYLSRFNRGELKSGAIVEILLANGYTVTAGKVEKKMKTV